MYCKEGKKGAFDESTVHTHSTVCQSVVKFYDVGNFFSWFSIVKISVICSYQVHTVTIEHRKNNHNNHKSVRIKEMKVATEKRFDQFMHQFYFICSSHPWNYTLIIIYMYSKANMHKHTKRAHTHPHTIK